MADETGKEECAWCKFMKGGPCRDVFVAWQACVDGIMDAPDGSADEEGRAQAVEQCAGLTGPLFSCLVQHPEYYGPQLDSMKQHSQEQQNEAHAAAGNSSISQNSSSSSSSSSSSRGNVEAGKESGSVAAVVPGVEATTQSSGGAGKLKVAAM